MFKLHKTSRVIPSWELLTSLPQTGHLSLVAFICASKHCSPAGKNECLWLPRVFKYLRTLRGRSLFTQQTLKVIWNVNWLWAVCKVPTISEGEGTLGPHAVRCLTDRHTHPLWLTRSWRNKVILMFLFVLFCFLKSFYCLDPSPLRSKCFNRNLWQWGAWKSSPSVFSVLVNLLIT